MSYMCTAVCLFAAVHSERMRSIMQRMNRPLSNQFYVVVAIAAVVVVAAWIFIVRMYRQRCVPVTIFSDEGLLDELAGAHHLSDAQRRLLGSLAEAADLASASRLFACPSRFEVAAQSLIASSPGNAAVQQQIRALQVQLFGDPPAD